jgi:vitamin B12/bleomycin/antimicrobial peptide transport system ATP-binding/permease protein
VQTAPANRNGLNRFPLRKFWTLASPYWASEEKWSALALPIVVMGMNLGMVCVQVLVNQWTRDFYNALQAVERSLFFKELRRFAELAAAYIVQSCLQGPRRS